MTPSEGEQWVRNNIEATKEILDRVGYPRKLLPEIGVTPNKRNIARFTKLCKELGIRYSNSGDIVEGTKFCRKCSAWKHVEHFSVRNSVSSGRSAHCLACTNSDQRSRWGKMSAEDKEKYKERNAKNRVTIRDKKRGIIIRWLLDHPCENCGESDIAVLEFAHVDRSTKHANVTELIHYSEKRLLEEMEKCKSLCANCHRRETMRECDSYKLHPEKYLNEII